MRKEKNRTYRVCNWFFCYTYNLPYIVHIFNHVWCIWKIPVLKVLENSQGDSWWIPCFDKVVRLQHGTWKSEHQIVHEILFLALNLKFFTEITKTLMKKNLSRMSKQQIFLFQIMIQTWTIQSSLTFFWN